jgi:hypothetical protein
VSAVWLTIAWGWFSSATEIDHYLLKTMWGLKYWDIEKTSAIWAEVRMIRMVLFGFAALAGCLIR